MQASDRQSDLLLEMKNITKEFPGVKALDGVSLRVRRGSVHALMGENGAGKSTLMKCLFGIYARDGGEILLEGNPVFFRNPREALENGVAMVHQELNQALKRSVMDNIWLGRYPTALGVYTLEKKMYEAAVSAFISAESTLPQQVYPRLEICYRELGDYRKAYEYACKQR